MFELRCAVKTCSNQIQVDNCRILTVCCAVSPCGFQVLDLDFNQNVLINCIIQAFNQLLGNLLTLSGDYSFIFK